MDEYVAFARARLDELETKANKAEQGKWYCTNDGDVYSRETYGPVAVGPWDCPLGDDGEHIAAHHPAYVLADIAAKRKILDAYEEVGFDPRYYDTHDAASGRGDALQECVRLICEPFASHPEYPGESLSAEHEGTKSRGAERDGTERDG